MQYRVALLGRAEPSAVLGGEHAACQVQWLVMMSHSAVIGDRLQVGTRNRNSNDSLESAAGGRHSSNHGAETIARIVKDLDATKTSLPLQACCLASESFVILALVIHLFRRVASVNLYPNNYDQKTSAHMYLWTQGMP